MEDSLELLALELINWPLEVLMSMFVAILLWTCKLEGKLKTKRKFIFTNSLLGVTIQNGSIRERSDVNLLYLLYLLQDALKFNLDLIMM